MKFLKIFCVLIFIGTTAQAASLKACASIFSDYDISQWCSSLNVEDSLVKACDKAFLFSSDKLDCIDEKNSVEKVLVCDQTFYSSDGKKGCLLFGESIERIKDCGEAFSSEIDKFDCI